MTTDLAPPNDAFSFREIRRRMSVGLPGSTAVEPGMALETLRPLDGERPKMAGAAPIEDRVIRRHHVPGSEHPAPAFEAFLDGAQESHVERYFEGVPVVVASVSAVIRKRAERRFATWRLLRRTGMYAPLRAMRSEARTRLAALGAPVTDTSDSALGDDDGIPHPFAAIDAAVHAVQRDRERLERDLALAWCASESRPLYIDGSIAGDPGVAAAPCVAGIVKSHRVLYGGADAFTAVLGLKGGDRTTAFRIASMHEQRSPVTSWYLRLRDATGRDPLWGLVRVEIASADAGPVTARADEVSRWILAEAAPLSLPDGRWDKLAYGVRSCEEYLRAVRA
jgi:hypothetical protein